MDTTETYAIILGLKVHLVTEKTLHEYIAQVVQAQKKSLILHTNIHCYTMINKNPWLQDFMNSSDITFCDGAGVIWGAKILGYQIPERITYADWMWKLAAFAAEKDFSFFFIGAQPGVATKAAEVLAEHFPNLCITSYHGYFNKEKKSDENKKVIEHINTVKPNILIVGFGMPIQEKWLQENWKELDVNIALTGGAVFDYVSEKLKRGPRWMTDNSMEWLARLLIEPKRLFWRYCWGNPVFFAMILRERLRRRS
uniref:WecB/TagA/CpsF family glycosyltransferase n=1 Tax=Candidatus Electronema sp. TaxID=2698783 RepID=UPI00405647B6